jgi:hypothetical protein
MGEVAHFAVDRRVAGPAVDRAFGNQAPRIDTEAQEHGRPGRPLIEQVPRKIAARQNRSGKVRRLDCSAITASRAIAAAAIATALPSRAGTRSGNGGSSLGRRISAPGRRTGRNLLPRRRFDPGLRRNDRSRFALQIPGCGARLGFFWPGLLALPLRRRKDSIQAEHAEHLLRAGKVELAGQVQQGEQQQCVDRDHRRNRGAAVARADVRAIGHARSTRSFAPRCGGVTKRKRRTHGGRPALTCSKVWSYRLPLALRPPPWLAFPPLLAISRCFAGSIAANPRFEPPLFVAAMCLLLC